MFPVSPKNRIESVNLTGSVLPLFSPQAALRVPLSSGQDLSVNSVSTGLGAAPLGFTYGSDVFVGSINGAGTQVPTSRDGVTWTLRTMPSSSTWRVGSGGSSFVAVDSGGTASAKSSDGLTWSAGGALSVSANADVDNIPVENSGNWLVFSSATTITRSTDGGTTWANQTLPVNNAMSHFLTVGGVFWYFDTANNGRTSPTGLTGSWTLRALPATPGINLIWQNPGEDAIYISAAANQPIYKTIDGINWTDTGVLAPSTTIPFFKINDVYYMLDVSSNNSYVQHGGYRATYFSSRGGFVSNRHAVNTRGTVVIPVSGNTILINDSNFYGIFK